MIVQDSPEPVWEERTPKVSRRSVWMALPGAVAALVAKSSSAAAQDVEKRSSLFPATKSRIYRTYVDARTGQVHARVAEPKHASRPPLICLHMSPMSSYVYRNVLPLLGTDRRVLALDTPGFGMSDPLPAYPSIGDYAAVTMEAIRALGLKGPVDILGYHTGSITAAELARAYPTRVRRIVMIGAPVLTPTERATLMKAYGPQPVSQDGSHLMKGWQRFIEFSQGPGVTIEQVADLYPERLLGRSQSWWGHRAAFSYEFADVVAALPHSIRVLNLRDDLWGITPRIRPLLKNGSVLDKPEWGHGFLDAYTAEAAQLLRELLDA